ncbi:MAG: hypothetical protein OSA39_00675 [Sphingobium sp.]|nr:hypothetical protein [Sphingobium sp.]
MRRQIANKLRRASRALRTAMNIAWLILLLAIAAILLTVVLAVGALAYFAFGWWGVAVFAAFVLAACFAPEPSPEPTAPQGERKGLNLNDDPNPWYMQSQYRFHHGPTNNHRGNW